jgi:YVTN family beta-propeller protein
MFYVLDTSARKRIFERQHPGNNQYMEASPDSKRLFTAANQLEIGLLDATPGSSYPRVARSNAKGVLGAAFHPDGSKVYYHNQWYGGGLDFANTKDLNITDRLHLRLDPAGTSISPDGKILCLVEMNTAFLHLIDIASKQVSKISIGDFPNREYRVVSSVWSPDGTKVYATNRTSGTVWIVKVATKEVSKISLGDDVTPALLSIGPEIPDFEEGSHVLYALCAPDGTVAGISTANDKVLSRLSLGQGSNPMFAFDLYIHTPRMAIAPDGRTIFVSNPPHPSIFVLDNGGQHVQQLKAFREGIELEGTVFDYIVTPNSVYITRDPHNPSIARLDIGVTNNTGSDMECDWISFVVIPGEGSGALTEDPGAISASSSRPDEWSITSINGAPGQFRAEPISPNMGLKAGQSISFRLDNITVNGELGGTRLEVIELVGETREKGFDINKIRGDLNIDFFRA